MKHLVVCAAAFAVLTGTLFAQQPKTPEEVVTDVSRLVEQGRIGYAADQYMGENSVWNGRTRDTLVAVENILFATKNKDLKTIFEQSQFIPGSGVDAAKSAELVKKLATLSPEKKEEILKKCRVKYDEAQKMFQLVGTIRIVKRVDVTPNTVALVLEEKGTDGKTYGFTALLNNRTGKWLIYSLLLNEFPAK